MRKRVLISGAFDDIRSGEIRFLEEASKLGHVTVQLWADDLAERLLGKPPKFPEAERRYFLRALRWVDEVVPVNDVANPNVLSVQGNQLKGTWVVHECDDDPAKRTFCLTHGLAYHVVANSACEDFPEAPQSDAANGRKKVIVTGCYDWLHSGHVRFFEEVSSYGDLYVVVGNDANIRLLKGEGHPLLSQEERRYVVGAIRYVRQALIATGSGWVDADPEIQRLRPDIYAVNEDGDRGGKREYCAERGIEYRVLRRVPAPGLPRRSSTDLRGF